MSVSRNMLENEHPESLVAEELEYLLAEARPRLAYLARKQGIEPDVVEDVVQETLIEAWKHLSYLRDARRFDSWLNGICHNICLRWLRKLNRHLSRQESLTHLTWFDEAENMQRYTPAGFPPSPVLDPAEEFVQQDLAVLLDRAMSYLSPTTRLALELCYLAELPSAEVASRLGLSVNALEVRMHRARQQLRRVLSSTLRDEAQTFGLALDRQAAEGWRPSRLWCFLCGRHRLSGCFRVENSRVNLLMYCPGCAANVVSFYDIAATSKARSFRPAMKRGLQELTRMCCTVTECEQPSCPACGRSGIEYTIEPVDLAPPYNRRYCLVIMCRHCGRYVLSSLMSAILAHPAAALFREQHPRWLAEPEDMVEYAGCEAVCVRLADIASSERVLFLIHPGTAQVLNVRKEQGTAYPLFNPSI